MTTLILLRHQKTNKLTHAYGEGIAVVKVIQSVFLKYFKKGSSF